MFRRRLTLVLSLFASIVVVAALLAAASLAVTERQVLRGRVASDIATGFIQLSAQKQRLRTWIAQMQLGVAVDEGARAELQSAMQGNLQRLKVLTVQALELDSDSAAAQEYQRRMAALSTLEQSVAALGRSAAKAYLARKKANEVEDGTTIARIFDMDDDGEMRMLIADNIAHEGVAVQRERAAADSTLAWVRWLWLGAAAVLAGATLAAAMYFGRALRYPLLQLNEGAQALQNGKLGHRIPLEGQDEFSSVALSVNALAAELEQHRERESAQRQQLEELVAARTTELAEALASLRQVDVQRRRLFADISHELRTPTTVIRGEAEITLRGVDKPAQEYRDALGRIVSTARQLGAVIDDLLAMARSDMDTLSLSRELVDMAELLTDALSQVSSSAAGRGLQLSDPPVRTGSHLVSGDPLRLRQLLGVLLDNATRYSQAGGRVDVVLATEKDARNPAGVVEVTVSNEGPGIAPHELARVFERRFRGAAARGYAPEGAGLGLSIARALVDAHGGDLRLHSAGGITRAVLRLPLVLPVKPGSVAA
jgi:signal transduction histidine kinase